MPHAILRAVHDAETSRRTRTFALTWLSYASYYLTRKPFSVAKKTLADEHGLSKQELANVDTGYLAAYAVGQFTWGFVADRIGPRRMIGAGMLATAGLCTAFGFSSTLAMFTLFWLANGLAQATGWPANVKAMESVPSPGRRGLVMGFWTTNYVIGGFVAGPIAAWFLREHGTHAAFYGPAIAVGFVGLLVLFFLPSTDRRGAATAAGPTITPEERRAARRRVLASPRVWVLGASYFFMKLARYALLFWLIYYGEKQIGYTNATATWIAMAFEAGGALGAILIGFASDRVFEGRRFPVAIASLACLAIAFSQYDAAAHAGMLSNVLCLAAIGFFLFGPDAILSGAAAQELGGAAAAATAAGIINGMGSIGPVLGSELWAGFSTAYGYDAAFKLLGGGALVAALLLVPFWNTGRVRAIGE